MTSTAAAGITALRATHDELAALVRDLSDEQLLAPSGATEWSVAEVLSHLGSGAEISAATLRSALDGTGALPEGFNQSVWDRWNAMSPREQADRFLAADTDLLSAIEALTPEQRDTLQVDLGFLPAPVPVSTYVGMRLGETAAHSWDVRVAFDEDAAIEDTTARLLVDQLAGQLGFLLGFTTRPDAVSQPAVVDLVGLDHDLSIGDAVALVPTGGATTATFEGRADAVARLMSGRLTAARTPASVTVSGNLTLEDLRRLFPGY
ncbi:MAG TPA: maleylpyruvate isomerase family mycothiol-dependent enzyme [Ornithinibacter sp.]|nr:maleylpyruvate isomerase family mycothiol-dependent enzyme [Ornithinibacter sp.]